MTVNIEYKTSTTNLHYKGTEILRTSETGVKVNRKAPLWRIAWSYTKYLWYKVRDSTGAHGPTSMVP